MSEMNCSEVKSRLDAYLADELEGTELVAMIAHFAGCPDCRQLAEARDPVKLFVPLAAREGNGEVRWDGFWEELSDRLEPRRRSGRLLRFPVAARWTAAAAAMAATVLIGLFLVQPDGGPVPEVPVAQVAPAEPEGDDLMEAMYIHRIAEALPARIIERSGEVRELRLTRVDERDNGGMNHYRAGGDAVPATVSDMQLSSEMDSIIEYSLVIAGDEGEGAGEEVRVVSFESEQFPFGCEAVRDPQ